MDGPDGLDTRHLAPTVCKLLGVAPPDDCEVTAVPEIVQGLASRPRIALVVVDAVGLATLRRHAGQAPFLEHALRDRRLPLQAVHPPVTPVNFASMATGLAPARHGIRDRQEKILNDTVFDALRRGRRTSAAGARAQSTLNILLAAKADITAIAATDRDREILARVEAVLVRSAPDFFWVQLLDADDAQHKFGVTGPSTGVALNRLDANLRHLCTVFGEQGYGTIICADHGQHDRFDGRGGTHDGTDPDDTAIPLTWLW